MSPVVIFLSILAAILLPANVVAYRALVRIHPRRTLWVRIALIAGNLQWLLFPMLRSFTPFSRAARAVVAPLWFGWASFALLYSMFLLLVVLAWLPLRKRRAFASFAHTPSRVFLTILIVGFFAGWFQAIVPLRVERITIDLDNLPPAAEGTRIALLGDLHVGLFTRPSRLTKIFATTAALEPDVAIIAGDLIDDDPHFVPKLLAGTRALPPSLPLLAVLGNHETYGSPYDVIRRLRGSRIRLLVNEGHALRDLWLAGLTDPAARRENETRLVPDLNRALAGKPAHALPVVLSHQPSAYDDALRRRLPLVLSAHTHGGQCGFRPLRWSLAGVFLKRHMGLYHDGPSQLYINTGTGYWVFPFRLGMTPEITLITLRKR